MRALEEIVVVRKFSHLRSRRIDDLIAAITGVNTPEARHAIEDLAAVRIENVHAFGTRNDTRTLFMQVLVIRKRMQVMLPIEFLPVFA